MAIRRKPWFFFSFVFLLSCHTNLCIGRDSITVGQSLSGNQTLISQGGTFELGFFKPGNSTNYYIGIWYKKISVLTVVWVANRNYPVKDPSSSKLTFLKEYGLSLLDQAGSRVWASFVPSPTVAVLLDDGNLVLKDGSSDSSIKWDSFYNPSDTWLPGAKFGCNKYRTQNGLTSWRSLEDPSAGTFLLLADTNKTNQLILKNVLNGSDNSYTYWTSSWNGQNFSLMDANILKYVKFSHVFTSKGSYFSYSLYNSSIPTRLVLDFFGQINLLMWVEDSKRWDSVLLHINICGSNSWKNGSKECKCLEGFEPRFPTEWKAGSWSGGCARKKELQCPNQGKNAFFMMNSIHVANNSKNYEVESIGQCKKLCLATCYCTAYAYNSLCTIWGDDLYIGQQVKHNAVRRDLHVLVLSELTGSTDKVIRKTYMVVGSIGATILLGILLLIVWKCRRKDTRVATGTLEDYLISYKYRALQRATKNFSEELGKGGFGSVFRGTLPDSTAIAVKRLGCISGEKQFRAEVSTIGLIHHKNLIRLRGFCAEGTKRLLVYDYMPNSSLNQHLFRKDSKTLDWRKRYNIALGIARGLTYLHEKCREYIIHCDIKPENVLLDAEFNPKVADFGLAKLLGRDFSRVLTSMRGTRGYLAPEWISGVAITTKADVYSFGMMLFELLSGRRNLDMTDDDMIDYFPARAANKVSNGEEVLSLLDQALDGNADHEELVRVCRVACWCIQEDEKDRPSMGQIVQVLEGGLDVGIPPIPCFLQLLLDFPRDQEYISTPDGRCMAVIRNISTSENKGIRSWMSSSLYNWFPFQQ